MSAGHGEQTGEAFQGAAFNPSERCGSVPLYSDAADSGRPAATGPFRLLRVISSMDPRTGGPCQGIRNSSGPLERVGVSTEVATVDDPAAAFVGKDGFPIHALGPARGAWRYSPNIVPWLKENLGRFDAVILDGSWQFPGFALYRAARGLSGGGRSHRSSGGAGPRSCPPWFVMPHGMLDPYFQRAPDRRLKALRNWLYWRLIEHRVIHGADGVLFTCEEELQLARLAFRPYEPRNATNVGYGVVEPPMGGPNDREAFLSKVPMLGDRPFLLFLSRIHPKKGVDLLLEAYIRLCQDSAIQRSALPDLVIAGPGMDTPYGEMLQGLADEANGFQRRQAIHFPGMLSGDSKWGAFRRCEAFVLPSHQENFGIAVVEALACSRPVLLSQQVNIWREIEADGGGLVEPDDLDGTERLLRRWLALSLKERTAMSAAGRVCFERRFEANQAAVRLGDYLRNYPRRSN